MPRAINFSFPNFSLFNDRSSRVVDPELHHVIRRLRENSACQNHCELFSTQGGRMIEDCDAQVLGNAVANHGHLTKLSLYGAQYGDEVLRGLAEAISREGSRSKLDTLCMVDMNIGTNGARALATLLRAYNGLRTLSLTACTIADDGWRELTHALVNNTQLDTLLLDGAKPGTDEKVDVPLPCNAMECLAEIFFHNKGLTSLTLRQCGIGPVEMARLARLLVENRTLETLSLEGNKLGDDGARALAAALAPQPDGGVSALNELNLSRCGIGCDGAMSLARLLEGEYDTSPKEPRLITEANLTLNKLDLGKNGIGDAGVEALFRAALINGQKTHSLPAFIKLCELIFERGLPGVPMLPAFNKLTVGLTFLDLRNNDIGPGGAISVLHLLKGALSMKQEQADDDDAEALYGFFTRCRLDKQMDLFDCEDAAQINEILARSVPLGKAYAPILMRLASKSAAAGEYQTARRLYKQAYYSGNDCEMHEFHGSSDTYLQVRPILESLREKHHNAAQAGRLAVAPQNRAIRHRLGN
ncbi:hypothetical protein [Chitinimonas arctica]|nr:hypothetical protein [Chitinimonas arctica]